MATEQQIQANREKSSLNAVKTGLTGRTVLLSSEHAAAYEQHVARFLREHQPVGDDEESLVRSIADTEWRLQRIPSLEAGIYALGRLELAGQFEMENSDVRAALIEAKTFLVYQKQLNNLSVQEGRLRRQRDADVRALRERQSNRQPSDKDQVRRKQETPSERIGFEFATGPLYQAITTSAESKRQEFARNNRNPQSSESIPLPDVA